MTYNYGTLRLRGDRPCVGRYATEMEGSFDRRFTRGELRQRWCCLPQIVMKTVVRSPPFCYNGRLFTTTRRRKPESTGREVSATRPSVNDAERKRAR